MRDPITKKSQQGFTLIELLIVVAIIGILAAIAIPQYAQYRTDAMNSAAESELKNVQTSLEGYYTTNNYEYPDTDLTDLDFETSDEVVIEYQNISGNQTYAVCAAHQGGDTAYFLNNTMSNMDTYDCGDAGDCDPSSNISDSGCSH